MLQIAQLEEELENKSPKTFANISRTLGEVHYSRAEYKIAEPLLEGCVEKLEAHPEVTGNSDLRGNCLLYLALTYQELGKIPHQLQIQP